MSDKDVQINTIHTVYHQIAQILSLVKGISKDQLKIHIDKLFEMTDLESRIAYVSEHFGSSSVQKLHNYLAQIGTEEAT
jgi:hypothetical protein